MMNAEDDDTVAGVPPAAEAAASSEGRGVMRRPPADAGGDIHSYIGARLRQAFDDVAQQPVPDRFLQLMRELDQS